MGWWGSLIVGRSEQPLTELPALGDYGETLELLAEHDQGWQVWALTGSELTDNLEQWVPALARQSRSPVLTGFVLDSDCVELRGFGVQSGWWSACLDRKAMQGYLAEDGIAIDEACPAPQAAARLAAAWSAEAGYVPDEPELLRVFQASGDPLVEPLFDELLEALGLPVED